MKIYTYKGISRIKIILSQGIGIVGIVLFSLLAGFLLINITKIQPYNSAESFINNPRVTLICFAIWFLVISWLIGFTFINYFPTIWVTDNGILISSFIFFRIFIPREEIKGEISGILLSESILIMVNKIIPFYYIWIAICAQIRSGFSYRKRY
jgi:hypothetical protein